MRDPLRGPRIKLERAKDLLLELERIDRDFFDKAPYRLVYEPNPDNPDRWTGTMFGKIVLDAEPPELAHVLAGEVIYQMRSSLDQIAVALARLSKNSPNIRYVYFPCGDNLKSFKSNARKYLKGFDNRFTKEILRFRPYDGANDALRAVFRMANIDKHMELIALGTIGNISEISQSIFTGTLILDDSENLKEGLPIGEFPNGWPPTIGSITVKGCIALGQSVHLYSGRRLLIFLREMLTETCKVYDLFQNLLQKYGEADTPIVYWRFSDGWQEI